jgi:hypothetical protein
VSGQSSRSSGVLSPSASPDVIRLLPVNLHDFVACTPLRAQPFVQRRVDGLSVGVVGALDKERQELDAAQLPMFRVFDCLSGAALPVVAKPSDNHHMHFMADMSDDHLAKARRAALLARKMKQGEESREAMADYESKQATTLTRTASLRAQRLAREAEPKPIASMPDSPKVPKPKRMSKHKGVG